MEQKNTDGEEILEKLSSLKKKDRVLILLQLFPEDIEFALENYSEVVRSILDHSSEKKTVEDEKLTELAYEFYDTVRVNSSGVVFYPEHFPNAPKKLLVSFRNRVIVL